MAIESQLDYQKLVWQLQCCYGTAVYNYSRNLSVGNFCETARQNLVEAMRLLKLLNRFDVQDVLTDEGEEEHNVVSYQSMLNVIHHLNTQCL